MRALAADGQVAAALAAYDRLARTLRDDLGTDPDRATADLHLALLREPGGADAGPRPLPRDRAARRRRCCSWAATRQLGALPRRVGAPWSPTDAADLVLVVGEGGIGKTRLLDAVADLVRRHRRPGAARPVPPGGAVPLPPAVRRRPAPRPRRAASATRSSAMLRDHEAAWASLVPDLGAVLPDAPGAAGRPRPPAPGDVRRRGRRAAPARCRPPARARPRRPAGRRCRDASTCSATSPGASTASRVLLVGAVRSEDRRRRRAPRRPGRAASGSARSTPPPSTPSPPRPAWSPLGDQVMARTAGHTLSVVECLRALGRRRHRGAGLAVGRACSPASTGSAPRRARWSRPAPCCGGGSTRACWRASPSCPRSRATRHGEELARGGLFVRSGAVYEFANDLFQECVYAALPPAVAAAYHRRAADLTSDRPEVMAAHAHAVGDDARAARGWLLAGGGGPAPGGGRGRPDPGRALPRRPGAGGGDAARALLVRGPGPRGRDAAGRPRSRTSTPRSRGRAASASGGSSSPRCAPAVATRRSAPSSPADELLGPARGRRPARRRARRPAGRGRLREPPGGAGGQPAAAGRRAAARRAGPGAGARGGLGGRRGAGPRRRSRPSRGTSATRPPWPTAVARARAARAGAPRRLAAPVGGVRVGVRARRRTTGWDEARDRVGAGARPQPPQRLPGLRRLPPGLRRLARPARRRPRRARAASVAGRSRTTSAVDHPWWHSWAAGLLAATLVRDGRDGRGGRPSPAPGWPRGAARRARGGCCAPRRSRPSPAS